MEIPTTSRKTPNSSLTGDKKKQTHEKRNGMVSE